MVDGLPADVGIGIVLPICSSPLATGLPVLLCNGIPPVALWFVEWRIPSWGVCDGSNIRRGLPKHFPMYQANSMYQISDFGRGSASHKDLEQVPVDWERGIISTPYRFYILKFSRIFHTIHSFLQLLFLWSKLLYGSVTFSQFVPGDYVNSHFLSSLQFFHFMDTSDASCSKCFFSSNQFFMRLGLPSSRFLIPIFPLSNSKRLEWACLWNSRMDMLRESTVHSCFKMSDFASASGWSLCSSRTILAASSGSENLNKVSSFPWTGWCPDENALFCRKVFLESAFLCVRRLRQVSMHLLGSEMNLLLSFLWRSDKLVIGRHLLLSPVSTVVKPACSVFAHRPHPTQEGEGRNALKWIISRRHTRSVEEHRFDQYWGIHFGEIFGLITCRQVRFSQEAERHIRWIRAGSISVWSGQQRRSGRWSDRRSDWSARGKWGSAQVWRKQHWGRVRHAVQDVKTTACETQRFVLTRWLKSWAHDLDLGPHRSSDASLPKLQKLFKSLIKFGRGFGVVFTPPVAYKRIAIACKRNTVKLGLKEKSLFIPTSCLPPFFRWFPPQLRWAWWSCRRIPSPSSFEVRSFSSFIVPSEWLTWSLSNLLTGMESCVTCCQTLHIIALWFWWLRGSLHVGTSGRSDLNCWAQAPKHFHVWSALTLYRYGRNLGPQSHRSVRNVVRSIRSWFVILDNEGHSGICQIWICTPFSLPS